jgi:hypothetical protein
VPSAARRNCPTQQPSSLLTLDEVSGSGAASNHGRQGDGAIGAERLAAVAGAEDDRAEEQLDDGVGIEVHLPKPLVETLLDELPALVAPLGEIDRHSDASGVETSLSAVSATASGAAS